MFTLATRNTQQDQNLYEIVCEFGITYYFTRFFIGHQFQILIGFFREIFAHKNSNSFFSAEGVSFWFYI